MRKMSMKMYRVWMAVLNNPGEWLDASDIASVTHDLTPRQVVSLMSDIRGTGIERGIADDRPRQIVRFNGPTDLLEELRREVITSRYQITDEHISAVFDAMSPVEWRSVSQISDGTGISKTNVSKILHVMPPGMVKIQESSANTLYRRARMDHHVLQYPRTPVPGHIRTG